LINIQSPTAGRAPAVTSWNAEYVDEMYALWRKNPHELSESWQTFFQGFELAMCPRNCVAGQRASLQSSVASLIYAYRNRGHMIAQLDPLGNNLDHLEDLEISEFGFTDSDSEEVFDTGHLVGPKRAKLIDIIRILKDTYCGSIGVEYIHIQDSNIRRWLQREMEPVLNKPDFDSTKKLAILKKLVDAEKFESFLHSRYAGQKRFSLEGAETLIALIHEIVELAPEIGIEEIIIGMAHRGRLNVLANILDKSYRMIFEEFEGYIPPESYGGGGDVKYHKGFSSDHRNRSGKTVHLNLSANPSHLEAVDPIVEGKVRAKQRLRNDIEFRKKVIPILIHGDSAFAGQGLVSETLNLSQLEGYRTGGTVHIIVNNQIGFTTNPEDSRSSKYCTDFAKAIDAPIFHVNGDDPEATVFISEIALKFRQEFGRDVVVDMLCYRRHGHNEGDEPAFTQPQMYKKIKNRPSVLKIYTKQLLESGVIAEQDSERIIKEVQDNLQRDFEFAHTNGGHIEIDSQDELWEDLKNPFSYDPVKTKVTKSHLKRVAHGLNTVPDGFKLNPKIERYLPSRQEAVENGNGTVDWGYGEALAFGTLLDEGTPVRLSGQDSQRGTFSHRHAVWQDMETMEQYKPLNHISADQAHFCSYNSPLSEASVLGFDYGYSLVEPRMLIIWEAQFGDFVNGAQAIIDQFIISSEAKWQRVSGLVMLLPHGSEGMGPEHSNAYLERYLAACAQQNIQVCNLTTPAQYFHVLRRQMKRPFLRPLIIMSPKSLLRHKLCVSKVSEFTNGEFQEILDDPVKIKKPKRLVMCSGKIFYDLFERREKDKVSDVAIVRIEQLYPIQHEKMEAIVKKYNGVDEIIWVQEETKNRGAWSFIRPWLQHLFPDNKIRYIGRGWGASPATGSLTKHREEQNQIVDAALHGDPVPHDVTILPEGAEK